MQIVINIDEARFKDIKRIAEVQIESNHFQTAEQIIANGTPLPKGHWKLKDTRVNMTNAEKFEEDNRTEQRRKRNLRKGSISYGSDMEGYRYPYGRYF